MLTNLTCMTSRPRPSSTTAAVSGSGNVVVSHKVCFPSELWDQGPHKICQCKSHLKAQKQYTPGEDTESGSTDTCVTWRRVSQLEIPASCYCIPGWQHRKAETVGSLSPMWKTWTEFADLSFGSSLGWPGLWLEFEK